MNKLIVSVILGILIAGILGFIATKLLLPTKTSKVTPPAQITPPSITTDQNVNYQAGFSIFTNGIQRNFVAAKYHNLSEETFLTADNPKIVQVKKRGITWDDFFKTLPMKLTSDCLTTGTGETFCSNEAKTLKFYLNGVRKDDLLSQEVKDGDRALISYGGENETQIQTQQNFVPNPKNLMK